MGAKFTGALLGLFVLVLGAGALILAVWGDDPLESGAQSALRLPERLPREINLFNAICGFGVAEDKDPAEEGYAAVSRVNKLLASPRLNNGEKLGDQVRRSWVSSTLSIEDEGGIICSPKAVGCLAQLRKDPDKLRVLAKAHETLLHRYRSLPEFISYQMELHPHVEAPLPKFRVLMATHRLWLGMQTTSYLQGDSAGLRALLSDLRFLRRALAQADDLVTKMVFTGMVVESLHVYAALMDKEGADLDAFPEIESLSAGEASLERALVSEFRFVTSALLTIEDNSQGYDELNLPHWLGVFALRPLFKPNRSVNSAYRCWQQAHASTPMARADSAARGPSQAKMACVFKWTDWISNPLGTIIVSTGQPDFGRYAARLDDLRGLVSLVNLKRSLRRGGITENKLAEYLSAGGARFSDPHTGKPMSWDNETRTLYFTSPQPQKGYHRLPLGPLD